MIVFYVVQVRESEPMLYATLYDTEAVQGILPAWTEDIDGALEYDDEHSAQIEAMERWVNGFYKVGSHVEVRVKV